MKNIRTMLQKSILIAGSALLIGCGFVEETDLLFLGPVYADWWDEAWSSRRRLTFNNGGQSENLLDFPVLVRLNSSRIDYGNVKSGGDDLRFIDGDGTELSYDIEVWNAGGESIVWVKVPRINGLSSSDYIWMYYGNGNAGPGESATSVWSNGYEAVLHLSEGTGNFSDSTPNNHFGQPFGVTQGVAGKTGPGAQFDGLNDYVALNMNYASQWIIQEITVSVWFNTSFTGASYNDNWAFVDFDRSDFYDFYLTGDTGALQFSTSSQGSSTDDFTAGTSGLNNGQWHLGWAVYDGTNSMIFLNGALDGTSSNPHGGNNLGINGSTRWGIIGDGSEATAFGNPRNNIYYEGFMDEIRLSSVSRSASWIAAQYLSMNDGFISYGTEENL